MDLILTSSLAMWLAARPRATLKALGASLSPLQVIYSWRLIQRGPHPRRAPPPMEPEGRGHSDTLKVCYVSEG